MDVPVYNMQGEQVGTMPVDEASLGGELNPSLVKQAYVMYHANLRQGSVKTKTRREVEGSGKKIYKQKGTGRARHGDKYAPQFKGGGHAKAKHAHRDHFRQEMPKKMRRKANRNALLAKLVDAEVKVIDRLEPSSPKTKEFTAFLAALGIDKTALVALGMDGEKSRNARLSARNVDGVTLCRVDQLTAWTLLNHRYVIIERSELEAWLSGPSSQTGKDAKINPMGRRPEPAVAGEAA